MGPYGLEHPMAWEPMVRREKQDKAADIVHSLHDEIIASMADLLDGREIGPANATQIDDSNIERIAEAVRPRSLKDQAS